MRILFDARSVRTPAGRYVFHGLTVGWLADSRVTGVVAALHPGFDRSKLPPGVEPLFLDPGNLLSYVVHLLPRAADRARADIIFSPNALAPRDPRSVLYFQDLYHFRSTALRGYRARLLAARAARAAWWSFAAARCLLGVAVASDIFDEVRRRTVLPAVLIPNGVEVDGLEWTGGDDAVVVTGGIGDRKDEATAIRAWAMIPGPERRSLRLEVLGAEPATRRRELADLAQALGVGTEVSIRGSLPRGEFLARIATARLAVSCSRLEAFGLPVAEALAMGAPVICTDLPSHRELLNRADAGAMYPARDADALARRMRAALREPPARHMRAPLLGWDWNSRARQHVDAYVASRSRTQVLGEPEGPGAAPVAHTTAAP